MTTGKEKSQPGAIGGVTSVSQGAAGLGLCSRHANPEFSGETEAHPYVEIQGPTQRKGNLSRDEKLEKRRIQETMKKWPWHSWKTLALQAVDSSSISGIP